jgi:hypothetical protein
MYAVSGTKFDIENCGNSELNLGQVSDRNKMTQLKAFNNTISTINYETFRGAYNLDSVDLQNNLIADILNETFRDIAKLTHLYISKNRLTKLNVGAFEGLSSLEHLHLDNNQLKILNVGTFDSLKNIRKINLFLNKLTLLEDGLFLKNENLFEINLNQNQIFAIGPKAFHWEKLERLGLKENLCADIERQFSTYDDRISYLSRDTKCFQSYPHFIEIYKAGIASSEKLNVISRERDEFQLKIADYEQAHDEEADNKKELIQCKINQTRLTEKLGALSDDSSNFLNNNYIEPEDNRKISLKFFVYLLGILFAISLIVNIVLMIRTFKKNTGPSSPTIDEPIPFYQTVRIDRSNGTNFVPRSSKDRVVDENFDEMDVEVYPDGRVHLYDRPDQL